MENNEQIQELLKVLVESIKQGKDFAVGQMPTIAQEIVTYGQITTTANVVIGAIIFLFGIVGFYYFSKSKGKLTEDECVLAFLSSSVLSIVGFIVFAVNISNCMKAWFTPHLYVLDYLANMVK